MSKILAPFSNEQVEGLNKYQQNPLHHPFTCAKCSSVLVATRQGWVCTTLDCGYTQNWAHNFMVEGGW